MGSEENRSPICLVKNDTFQLAISPGGDHSQNVHIVSHYHSQLKDILGLSSGLGDFQERIGTLEMIRIMAAKEMPCLLFISFLRQTA